MHRSILVLGALFCVAGCDKAAEQPAANAAAAKAAEPEKKHPTYCFFKDADIKGWSASRDASGNIAVKGQARIPDRRYMASLAESEVEGGTARLWLTMAPNTTGSGAPGDWWDVTGSAPDSAAATSVTVLCGKKVVAELPVKKR